MRRWMAITTILFTVGILAAQTPGDPSTTPVTVPSSASTLPVAPTQPLGRTPTSYLKQSFGYEGLILAGASAGINQGRDFPHEWNQGLEGYGRRFASSYGNHVVSRTIHLGVAEVHHEALGYQHSGLQAFGPRLRYALLSSLVTKKTNGDPTIALGEISGAVGAGFASRLWMPASQQGATKALSAAGVTLLMNSGIHVVREFVGHQK